MDLNYYYDIMAKELFPNAQVILDRFHIVQMLNVPLIPVAFKKRRSTKKVHGNTTCLNITGNFILSLLMTWKKLSRAINPD